MIFLIKMAYNTKNFKVSDFDCKNCSCGNSNRIKQETIDLAQKIRDYIGMPMKITAGYRCDNKQVLLRETNVHAAKGRSAHQDGEAFDFNVPGLTAVQIGQKIKDLYHTGTIPELKYCYLITSTAVHCGIDNKNRSRIFAF